MFDFDELDADEEAGRAAAREEPKLDARPVEGEDCPPPASPRAVTADPGSGAPDANKAAGARAEEEPGGADDAADAEPLFLAIRRGDLEELVSLLQGAPELVRQRYYDGRTPLNAVVELLGSHPDVAPKRVCEMTRALLRAGADANIEAPPLDETPLQVALRQFMVLRAEETKVGLEVVRLLLEGGADPNHADELGETPLFEASCSGSVTACELLLSFDASLTCRNFNGSSVLDMEINDDVREVLEAALQTQAPGTSGQADTAATEPPRGPQQQEEQDALFDADASAEGQETFSNLRSEVAAVAAELAQHAEGGAFKVGALVQIVDLKSAPQHNGRRGVIEEFSGEKRRWAVQLQDGTKLLLKPANLQAASSLDEQGRRARPTEASAQALREQGNAHFKAGNYQEARDLYTDALALEPSSSSLLSNRAATCLMLKDWQAAFDDATQAVRCDPFNVKACERVARSLLLQNRLLPEAMQFCQARMKGLTPEQQASPEWRPMMAIGQRIMNHSTALQQMEQALNDRRSSESEGPSAQIVQGVSAMRGLLTETELASPFGERLGFCLVRALLLPVPGRSGQSPEARERATLEALAETDRLLREKPEWPDSHHWRARCLLRLGRRREAREALREALRIVAGKGSKHQITEDLLDSMTVTETQKGRGNDAFKRHDWAAALTAYDAAVQADEGRWDVELSAQLLCNRSSARSKFGAVEAALEDAGEAVALKPSYAKALFRRGLLYMELGRYGPALSDFELVARLEPNFAGLSEWLPRARHWSVRPPSGGTSGKNYYSLLGVAPTATPAEIKKAYKAAALKWHPDKNADDRERAEKTFKDVLEAFEVLSDPRRRWEYDGMDQGEGHGHEAPWGGARGANFPRGSGFGWGRSTSGRPQAHGHSPPGGGFGGFPGGHRGGFPGGIRTEGFRQGGSFKVPPNFSGFSGGYGQKVYYHR